MNHPFLKVVSPVGIACLGVAISAFYAVSNGTFAQPQPTASPDPELTLLVGSSQNPCEHVIAPAQFACGSDAGPAALTACSTHALYAFSQDVSGSAPKCKGACAEQWPPVIVMSPDNSNVVVKPPLQDNIAQAVPRDAENNQPPVLQESYGGHPLYRFVGDQSETDTLGQCVMAQGGTFQLVKPDGTLCPCDSPSSPPPPPPSDCSGGSCGGGGCAPPTVCGWTPGYKCPSYSNVANCDPTCCKFDPAWLSECPGRNMCGYGGGGGGTCGTPTVCGWTPGYKCPSEANIYNCDPTCCKFDPAWLSECPGRNTCGYGGGSGGGGACGTPTVCGWTPGYKCPSYSNVANCDPTCCKFDPAWLSECPGRSVCGR